MSNFDNRWQSFGRSFGRNKKTQIVTIKTSFGRNKSKFNTVILGQ